MLMFQLLLLMFCLVVIGEPLRVLISYYSGLFKELDILQISVLDVYFGGLILYAIGMLPLHLFSPAMAWVIILTSCVLSILIHWKKIKAVMRRSVYEQVRKHADIILVITLFLIVLYIGVTPTVNIIFGNIHDSSLYGLLVQLISENKNVPETLAPYEPSGIIYPQAFSIKLTFASYSLGFSPAEAALRVTPLFHALSVLGAYYLGKAVARNSRLGVSLAYVFSFVSRWPRLLAWGSNAFVCGFPLYFISLSFLPSLLYFRSPNGKTKLIELSIIGILFGYLAAIHIIFYEVLIVSVALAVLFSIFHKRERVSSLLRNFLIILGFSLIPIGVNLYRLIKWWGYPGHNIGLPHDVTAPGLNPLVTNLETISWCFFDADWISPYQTLKIEIIGLIVISSIVIFVLRKSQRFILVKEATQIALISLSGSFVTIFLSSRELGLFPIFVEGGLRAAILSFVSLCLLISIFIVLLHSSLFSSIVRYVRYILHHTPPFLTSCLQKIKNLQHAGPLRSKHISVNNTARAIVAFAVMLTYISFIIVSFTVDVRFLTYKYGLFSVTTGDDYNLMLWMRDKLPEDAIILVNPYDAGGFIPSVSQHRVIYPFTGSRSSISYQTLVDLINQRNLSATAYHLMKHFNVTHVFVGSRAVSTTGFKLLEESTWDPLIFLNDPNFKLIKTLGEANLFAFTHTEL